MNIPNTYKYKTIQEIKSLPEYQKLHTKIEQTTDPHKKFNEGFELYCWYSNQLAKCEEYQSILEKQHEKMLDEFVDVKEIAIGDKIFKKYDEYSAEYDKLNKHLLDEKENNNGSLDN